MAQKNFFSPHRSNVHQVPIAGPLFKQNESPLFSLLGQRTSNEDFSHVIPNVFDGEFGGLDQNANDNLRISAGWTYFGQLLAHDLTVRREFDDNRPRLNLDCIYGLGPQVNVQLYELYEQYGFSSFRFALDSYFSDIQGIQHIVYDVFRTGRNSNMPIMADARNDDNFLLNQLHCAFLRFHNKMLELFCRKGFHTKDSADPFIQTRRFVTWTYQWLIVNEYLKLLTGEVVDDLLNYRQFKILRSAFFQRGPLLMPECVAAALRMGHSQVRGSYNINPYNENLRLFDNPDEEDLAGFKRSKGRGAVDWRFFFLFEDDKNLQYSRSIDLLLAEPMREIPGPSGVPIDIAWINVQRSVQNGLLIRIKDLGFIEDKLCIGTLCDFEKSLKSLYKNIDTSKLVGWNEYVEKLLALKDWPLWLFLLLEARVKGADKKSFERVHQRLGPLGAQIIAEQILWALLKDKNCYLACDPSWHPLLELNELFDGYKPVHPNSFSIVDLLQIAENYSPLNV